MKTSFLLVLLSLAIVFFSQSAAAQLANHSLNGTAQFNQLTLAGANLSWQGVAPNVNDNALGTHIGFGDIMPGGHDDYEGEFEGVVTFASTVPTITRVEYEMPGNTDGHSTDFIADTYLRISGAWVPIDSRKFGYTSVGIDGPWNNVDAVKVYVWAEITSQCNKAGGCGFYRHLQEIRALGPAIPPVANAGPDQSTPSGVAVAVSGACTDSDGTVSDCDWSLPSGCSFVSVPPQSKAGLGTANASSDASVSCVGAVGSVFTLDLTATDDDSDTGSDSMDVTIVAPPNVAPVADAGGPYVITLPSTVVGLDGSASVDAEDCPGGGVGCPMVYGWVIVNDPVSGADCELVASGVQPSITCTSEGSADVTLTVTDSGGLSDTALSTITVLAAAPSSSWFKIVSFELDPNTAILGVSDSINAKVTVTNLGIVVENAEVAITAKDLTGNSVSTGTVPMTLPVGAAEVEFDFTFSVATWEASNYAVTATASAVGAPQPDSKKTAYLVVLEELTVPVPELSVLLLPLLLAVVLFVLRKK